MAEERLLIAEPGAEFLTSATQHISRLVAPVIARIAALFGKLKHYRWPKVEEDHLSLLMDAVDDAVILIDADLRLVAQNQVARRMLGRSLTETVGRSIDDMATPGRNGSPSELGRLVSQAMKKRQRISFDTGISLAARQNGHIFVGGRVVPIVRNGQTAGAICAFRELVSDKDGQRVGVEFANMASHLLRTPLSSLYALIDLLGSELDAEDQQATLDQMREQSRRMKRFITELLDMSRVESGAFEVHTEVASLFPLVARALDIIRREEPGHTFHLVSDGVLPAVAVDPRKIELVVLTLLRSAVGRCPDGGRITIDLEHSQSEIIVTVIDDGKAIPAEQLRKVFWQFYPVDGDGKIPSTYHLGLFTVRRLIELQKGRIWAHSRSDVGSRFSFSLPVWG